MKLGEMISLLRITQRVEVRDSEQGNELFTSRSDTSTMDKYKDCEVTEWFAGAAPYKDADFTVYIIEETE